jgi:hypothetical protein
MNENENYDDFIDFDYLDYDDWINYIKKYILPLRKEINVILGIRNKLENTLEKNFKELFNTEKNYQEILLGGIKEDGDYEENSLAKIYREALGIYIEPTEWIIPKRRGLDPFNNEFYLKTEETPLLIISNELNKLLTKITSKFDFELENYNHEIENIVNEPEKLVDIFADFYKNLINFSAAYNQQTFFVINFLSIPRYYIENAYLRLKEKFDTLIRILGLKKIFIPSIKDSELKKKYSIWSFSQDGLGQLIYSLQRKFEKYFDFNEFYISYDSDNKSGFDPKLFKNFFNLKIEDPINLKEKYIETMKDHLKLPTSLNILKENISITGYNKSLQLAVKGDKIVHITNGYSPNTGYAYMHKKTNIPLLEFIDKIVPYLFTNLAYLKKIKEFNYQDRIISTEKRDEYEYLKFINFWSN